MPSANSTAIVVRKPRRPSPKARTGCATCKLRRVKCDEEKPYCKRCTSTGRTCAGYPQSARSSHFGSFAVTAQPLIMHSVSSRPELGNNVHYLEFYHRRAATTLSSRFDKEFWARTPLQMAQSELCVRHALLALSYLNKSESGTLKDARSSLANVVKHKTLLTHYNKAVNLLVARMSHPSFSLEVGLVCCLLFIAIELMRGDHDTTMSHFRSGLDIISTYRRRQKTETKSGNNVIEDSLIPMFTRLMTNGVMYGLESERVAFTNHYPFGTNDCKFYSVWEAESSMCNIRNMALILIRNLGTKVVQQIPHTAEELQAQKDCLEYHHTWLRALEKLEAEFNLSQEDIATIHSLKAQHHCIYIFTATAILTHQTQFDAHLDLFKRIVHHTRVFLDSKDPIPHNTPGANFTFDLGIIPGLYMTVCRCRCPTTRREALALLERNLPREGLWDAQQHALVAKRVIELEESDIDPITGWPVESARIWSTQIHGDMDGNGRFPVFIAIGHWGEGRGAPPLPEGMRIDSHPNGRIWREWFVL
ncbi:hypothetical protein BKA63DRAFT_422818 [Paraphoma chrysanthemicola]|nr:hypothetical protein BKA63DRAFT_422818 [Paraphoma chrysanthemicola]